MNFLPRKQPKLPILASSVAGFLALGVFALAGSLTPPGAVGSTMNTLAELYASIAGTFDSTAVVANQNGSLIEHLKYIEANMPDGVGSDSLDFDEFVDAMTLDADTSIASAGFVLTIHPNVGIGGAPSTAGKLIVDAGAAQFPVGIIVSASNHATSERATLQLGSHWQLLQDKLANGTTDFGIYNANSPAGYALAITTTGSVSIGWAGTYPQSKLQVIGNQTIGANWYSLVAPTNGLIVEGNVGIGDSTPTTTLDVAGSASVSGTLETGGMVINGHILPGAHDTYDLGSSTVRWRDLYLASGSLHIGVSGDEAVIDYNVTDDYLAFKPDGSTTRMAILDAGNVGIGVTAPQAKLDVLSTTEQLRLTYDASNYASFTVGSTGSLTTNLTGSGQSYGFNSAGGMTVGSITNAAAAINLKRNSVILGGMTTTNNVFSLFGGTTAANHLTINSSGNVGIGTTTPEALLHVNGTASVSGNFQAGTGTTPGIYVVNNLVFMGTKTTNTVSRVTISNSGTTYGMILTTNGAQSSNGLLFRANTSTAEISTNNAIPLVFQINGAERARFDASGNLGIGTANVEAKLEVAGTASVSGNVFLTGLSAADADDVYICRDPTTNEITTSAAACVASSLKFKKNVEDLNHGLDWVHALRPVTFDWKHNGKPSLGFIAEEVDEVSPLLTVRQDGAVFSVNYQIMTSVLAKAIQELDGKIEGLATQGPMDFSSDSWFDGLFARIVAAFRDMLGIEFGERKICLGDTCINEEQLRELMEQGNVMGTDEPEPVAPETPTPQPSEQPAEPTPTPEPTTTPSPEPEINGSPDEPFEESASEPEEPAQPEAPEAP